MSQFRYLQIDSDSDSSAASEPHAIRSTISDAVKPLAAPPTCDVTVESAAAALVNTAEDNSASPPLASSQAPPVVSRFRSILPALLADAPKPSEDATTPQVYTYVSHNTNSYLHDQSSASTRSNTKNVSNKFDEKDADVSGRNNSTSHAMTRNTTGAHTLEKNSTQHLRPSTTADSSAIPSSLPQPPEQKRASADSPESDHTFPIGVTKSSPASMLSTSALPNTGMSADTFDIVIPAQEGARMQSAEKPIPRRHTLPGEDSVIGDANKSAALRVEIINTSAAAAASSLLHSQLRRVKGEVCDLDHTAPVMTINRGLRRMSFPSALDRAGAVATRHDDVVNCVSRDRESNASCDAGDSGQGYSVRLAGDVLTQGNANSAKSTRLLRLSTVASVPSKFLQPQDAKEHRRQQLLRLQQQRAKLEAAGKSKARCGCFGGTGKSTRGQSHERSTETGGRNDAYSAAAVITTTPTPAETTRLYDDHVREPTQPSPMHNSASCDRNAQESADSTIQFHSTSAVAAAGDVSQDSSNTIQLNEVVSLSSVHASDMRRMPAVLADVSPALLDAELGHANTTSASTSVPPAAGDTDANAANAARADISHNSSNVSTFVTDITQPLPVRKQTDVSQNGSTAAQHCMHSGSFVSVPPEAATASAESSERQRHTSSDAAATSCAPPLDSHSYSAQSQSQSPQQLVPVTAGAGEAASPVLSASSIAKTAVAPGGAAGKALMLAALHRTNGDGSCADPDPNEVADTGARYAHYTNDRTSKANIPSHDDARTSGGLSNNMSSNAVRNFTVKDARVGANDVIDTTAAVPFVAPTPPPPELQPEHDRQATARASFSRRQPGHSDRRHHRRPRCVHPDDDRHTRSERLSHGHPPRDDNILNNDNSSHKHHRRSRSHRRSHHDRHRPLETYNRNINKHQISRDITVVDVVDSNRSEKKEESRSMSCEATDLSSHSPLPQESLLLLQKRHPALPGHDSAAMCTSANPFYARLLPLRRCDAVQQGPMSTAMRTSAPDDDADDEYVCAESSSSSSSIGGDNSDGHNSVNRYTHNSHHHLNVKSSNVSSYCKRNKSNSYVDDSCNRDNNVDVAQARQTNKTGKNTGRGVDDSREDEEEDSTPLPTALCEDGRQMASGEIADEGEDAYLPAYQRRIWRDMRERQQRELSVLERQWRDLTFQPNVNRRRQRRWQRRLKESGHTGIDSSVLNKSSDHGHDDGSNTDRNESDKRTDNFDSNVNNRIVRADKNANTTTSLADRKHGTDANKHAYHVVDVRSHLHEQIARTPQAGARATSSSTFSARVLSRDQPRKPQQKQQTSLSNSMSRQDAVRATFERLACARRNYAKEAEHEQSAACGPCTFRPRITAQARRLPPRGLSSRRGNVGRAGGGAMVAEKETS